MNSRSGCHIVDFHLGVTLDTTSSLQKQGRVVVTVNGIADGKYHLVGAGRRGDAHDERRRGSIVGEDAVRRRHGNLGRQVNRLCSDPVAKVVQSVLTTIHIYANRVRSTTGFYS